MVAGKIAPELAVPWPVIRVALHIFGLAIKVFVLLPEGAVAVFVELSHLQDLLRRVRVN